MNKTDIELLGISCDMTSLYLTELCYAKLWNDVMRRALFWCCGEPCIVESAITESTTPRSWIAILHFALVVTAA